MLKFTLYTMDRASCSFCGEREDELAHGRVAVRKRNVERSRKADVDSDALNIHGCPTLTVPVRGQPTEWPEAHRASLESLRWLASRAKPDPATGLQSVSAKDARIAGFVPPEEMPDDDDDDFEVDDDDDDFEDDDDDDDDDFEDDDDDDDDDNDDDDFEDDDDEAAPPPRPASVGSPPRTRRARPLSQVPASPVPPSHLASTPLSPAQAGALVRQYQQLLNLATHPATAANERSAALSAAQMIRARVTDAGLWPTDA